jgi:hypothetical protein
MPEDSTGVAHSSLPGSALRQTCFVDMPFGKKVDPKTGVTVDFDQVFHQGIRPAVEAAGLQCIRGDQEETGGLIHTAMFARLLLAEFVVADMTTANPNVFYELGVRHAARPYTTIPIFATIGAPPFDVNGVRAIPYELAEGKLTPEAAASLVESIKNRIQAALASPVATDSPLFQLFNSYPGISMSHELTDVFRDRVTYSTDFRTRLGAARALKPKDDALKALKEIEGEFAVVATAERGVVVDLLLSYRAVEAFDAMVSLYARMSGEVQAAPITRQQLAFALNRRKGPGDRDRAIAVLEDLRRSHGDSAETLGLLGRIYKDLWREAKERGDVAADGWLDEAIQAYRRGFEVEPLDYYPGINTLTLLLQKGDDDSMDEIKRLAPLVTFAAVRKGGEKAGDYWTLATMVELGALSRDPAMARRSLPRAVALVQLSSESWMLKTTRDNLALIAERFGPVDGAPVVALVEQFERAIQQVEKAPPAS